MNITQLLKCVMKTRPDKVSVTEISIYFKDGEIYKPVLNARAGTIGYDTTEANVIILSSEVEPRTAKGNLD